VCELLCYGVEGRPYNRQKSNNQQRSALLILDKNTAKPYYMHMPSISFIELPPFTRYIYRYMSDEEYQGLQDFLAAYPNAGNMISGTRGCRKVRWSAMGRGKRGGVRVIYFYQAQNGRIYLLTNSSCYLKFESTTSFRRRRNPLLRGTRQRGIPPASE
jgi:mRNA-degrading endonuclease RelE of RelBE toxin-antitoxin system